MVRGDERRALCWPVLVAGKSVGTTRDLARRGIGLALCQPVCPRQQLALQICAAGALHPLHMAVEVVWCREAAAGQHHIGARLLAISVKDALILSRLFGSPAAPRPDDVPAQRLGAVV